jgi:ectoine hydroxylase-related dioxygenase (phytanoyl-CoA dioxygenase family)
MEILFKDKKHQEEFEQNGYVVLPFLSEGEIDFLSQTFDQNFPDFPDGFYSTSFSKDEQAKKNTWLAIDEIFDAKIQHLAMPYRKLGSCFLTKSPGDKGEMPIHQDWTIVDEPRYHSITVWVPLCDVDDKNGAMQAIPGSHKFSKALRSPSIPDPLDQIAGILRKDLVDIPMKAGEALVFSQALFHASPPNKGMDVRKVVTFGFIPQEAELFFHYLNEEGRVEKYKVPDSFFGDYNTEIGGAPRHGDKVDEFDYPAYKITPEEYQLEKNKFMMEKSTNNYKMIPVFRDEALQQFFEKEGYAVFPLLEEDEVNELKDFYGNLNINDEKGYGFHVSMDQKDKEKCRLIRDKIWGITIPALSNHLKDFKPFVASFVIKEPNPKGVVPAHQDWSFADKEEEGYCSITCWVALVETSLDNGQMGVIKGSHKIFNNKRASPSPQVPVPLANHMFSVFPYLKTIDMKPGEVLMFDNRTFHASPPNITDVARLAVGVGITQKDAQLVHYYLKPDGSKSIVQKYAVDEDFYLKYDNSTLSEMYDKGETIQGYDLLGEEKYNIGSYSTEELTGLIKAEGNEFNVPMVEKLSVLFGYNMDGTKSEPEPVVAEVNEVSHEPEKKKPFFETYTPYNIYREVKFRITGK